MTYTFSLWQFFSYGNFFYSPNAVPCVVVQLHFQFDCCICLFVAWVAIFCILFSVFCFLFSVFRFFLLFYVFRFLFIVFQFQLFIFGFSVFHFWFSFFSVSIFSFFAFCFPFLLSVFRFHCPILLTSYRFKAKPDPLVWTSLICIRFPNRDSDTLTIIIVIIQSGQPEMEDSFLFFGCMCLSMIQLGGNFQKVSRNRRNDKILWIQM